MFHSSIILKWIYSLCLVAASVFFSIGNAGILSDQKGIKWKSHYDLTGKQFSAKFKEYSKSGFMLIDVDTSPHGQSVLYSMVWRENTDGRRWAEHRGMTTEKYRQRWEEYRTRGYRPLDVETYRLNGNRRWAGIWVENKENIRWASYRGLTHKKYGDIFKERSGKGFRLADVEAYRTGSGMRYAAIWVENKDNRAWAQLRNMTRKSYQANVDKRSANGFRVVDFEAYNTSAGMRYAAIWEKKPGYRWQTRTNRTSTQFANLWREYLGKGYRLIDFERYNTSVGLRYAGLWVENHSQSQSRTMFIDFIPDFTQTDIVEEGTGDGQQYCAPVAVSNSFSWLQQANDQRKMILSLASSSYMNTNIENGTGTRGVMNGVDKFAKELFGGYENLAYEGWRKHPDRFAASTKIPNLNKLFSFISHRTAAWLNIGWYKEIDGTNDYERVGGHWVTLVGTTQNKIVTHDPAPRAGQEFSNEFVSFEKITEGTLRGDKYNELPVAANGYIRLTEGLDRKRSSYHAILDGVVYFTK